MSSSVTRTDTTPDEPVVSYVYGTTNGSITNGMVSSVTDELTGVENAFTYHNSGSGIGQVAIVSESGGPNSSYTVSYGYNSAGDREYSTYATTHGTVRWKYTDYLRVGAPEQGRRAFQTLNKMEYVNGAWALTPEEFHYQYDSAGRLWGAAFAQTPQSGQGYNVPAETRARAWYQYDAGGRVLSLEHYWDDWNGSNAYVSQTILANSCVYDTTKGLKSSSQYWAKDPNNAAAWVSERNEVYSYESERDSLTGVDYNDGLANEVWTWSYDAAGNRNGGTYDNLNRLTAYSSHTYTNDILGNRTGDDWGSGNRVHEWDCLNRLTLRGGTGWSNTYVYRADGMRVRENGNNTSYTGPYLWRYDGQMPIEQDYGPSNGLTVTRNGLGARGIDFVEELTSTTTTLSYPIYDAHGNTVAYIRHNGGNYPTIAGKRSFDVWGRIRSGGTGGSRSRYSGNLGHIQDEGSQYIYMRARYMDPVAGRFISEDPALDDLNWFVYCGNDPVGRADASGRVYIDIGGYWFMWDHPYSQEGTGAQIQDLTWGDWKGGQRQRRGSVRPDGSAKHGEIINDGVRKIVQKSRSSKALGLLNKAARGGGYGLAAYALVCSLDAAFLSDPAAFADLIGYVGGDWELLGGFVIVGAD